MPSRSKGSSQPSLSPVKRWSRFEGRSTVYNHRFIRFSFTGFTQLLPSFISHFRESNEPDLAPCRARSSRADPFFHRLLRLLSFGSLTRNVLSESCDSHGCFPDSFPRALRLGNTHLQLREARTSDLCLYEVSVRFKGANA
ncbi:hypothetical protein CRG98_048023 [Punica granatum]|uniref:Uncharacterized protein n=1 Tax=Punica granatum TaxID=22663 RepID=A0A2I0HJU0_PUNGR|nr:hypothetical protein CRG98_048023 [Punica granatum]